MEAQRMEAVTLSDEIDSRSDKLRELAAAFGFPPNDFVTLVLRAEQDGIIETEAIDATEAIRRVLLVIGEGSDARLKVWCIDYLIGANIFGGRSETVIARKLGYTRANVSRCIRQLQAQLGTPSRGVRTERACGVYAERAKKAHERGVRRRKAEPWNGARFFQI